ncbi:DinB family protein [Bacillus sp. JJ722]|uniref:DinB family protein n=1 Tax=Bacillus sp. JJ722 TaxID=3122973 RepID=UPI002FFD62EF
MKSKSISNHFLTINQQRNHFLPKIESLSQEKLWNRNEDGKWSIGEHIYHMYLILRMLKVATKFSFILTPYAKLRRNTPFPTEIHDIYAEYKEKKGKGMNAPWILVPQKNIRNSMEGRDLVKLLSKETNELKALVKGIDEDIAGHIVFFDPLAKYPNLIQAIQLLAIHEKHHFEIIEKNYETGGECNIT